MIATEAETQNGTFAHEVQAGLTADPKSLPCRFFYDRKGSLLYEAICEQPEYYLTRAEAEILRDRAGEITSRLPRKITLVELGSGSAVKTRALIEEQLKRQTKLRFIPIDISPTILEESSLGLVQEYVNLEIRGIIGEYDGALRHLKAEEDNPKLLLWLGSSIGNLERCDAADFLRWVAETMLSDDRLLVGIDLRKERAVLECAYDDSRGVTARFNKNILTRINRELGGRFDVGSFRHKAVYQEQLGRIEMYLVSERAQRVSIDRLGLKISFDADEAMHTENCYKYSVDEIDSLAESAGLILDHRWFDSKRRFSVNLFAADHGWKVKKSKRRNRRALL